MTLTHALNTPIDTSPSRSWRKKSRPDKAMPSISNINGSCMESFEYSVDPDAQATVTDFLDFTEYLPSDMIRSLTLIGNLDQIYYDASAKVHELTSHYAALPSLPAEGRADSTTLRKNISINLDELINARTLAQAEAVRMTENLERHYKRLKNILMKLQYLADDYPPSREVSPSASKSKPRATNRPQKLTLRLDGKSTKEIRDRRRRNIIITVPGEVLAPFEVECSNYDDESEDDDSEDQSPLTTPTLFSHTSRSNSGPKLRITHRRDRNVQDKSKKKEKKEKAPRPPRTTRVMGTNAHNSVARISTSNALAQLKPPPASAKPGDKDLPWLQLNAWELAKLRKRMKKNAIWSPSDTMIARELKSLGRGIEAYRLAVKNISDTGEALTFEEPPQLRGETVNTEGAISVEAVRNIEAQSQSCNNKIKLNDVKRQRRDQELALAAEEAEEAARQMMASAEAMKDLFNENHEPQQCHNHQASEEMNQELGQSEDKSLNKPLESKKILLRPSKLVTSKRKREEVDVNGESISANCIDSDADKKTRPLQKKNKNEQSVSTQLVLSVEKVNSNLNADQIDDTESEIHEIVSPVSSHKPAVQFPILPSKSPNKLLLAVAPTQNESKNQIQKDNKTIETAANSRCLRTSGTQTPITPVHLVSDTALIKRPTSSRGQKPSTEGVAVTATATIDRPRRISTAQNTPAPEPRNQIKHNKRPAPGIVTTNYSGSTSVSINGKRSRATRKKPGPKKDRKDDQDGGATQELFDEFDDEGNLIDPAEARYCICNRVSFGVMIGCEGPNCEKEWFHLECVGLLEVPPRTTKWYCPSCRVSFGIGEKGEINARGVKK